MSKVYRKIRVSKDDLSEMISDAIRNIGVLREENIYDNGDDTTISYNKELDVRTHICVGLVDKSNGSIVSQTSFNYYNKAVPVNGISYDKFGGKMSISEIQSILQSEIEIRRAHLEGNLNSFMRKMNELDPEISIRKTEFTPYKYNAELVIQITSSCSSNDGFGTTNAMMAYNRMAQDTQKKADDWLKNCGYPISYVRPFNWKPIPMVQSTFVKVGEVEVTGYKCNVMFEKGGFQLGGCRYVGTVQPYTNAEYGDDDANFADVKLMSEFEGDLNLKTYLQKASGRMRCDGCGKRSTRCFYYVFMDQNNQIHYYGRNCAERIFGINIMEKLDRFMAGLNKLGEFVDGPKYGRNMSSERVEKLVCVMLHDGVLDKRAKFDYKRIAQKTHCLDLESDSYATYSDEKELNQFYRENIAKIKQLAADFYQNGNEYFRSIDSAGLSEFGQKVKLAGIALTSGDDTAMTGRMPDWAPQYALQTYFATRARRQTAETEKASYGEIKQVPFFNGYRAFDCEVLNVVQKTSQKSGNPYFAVQAVTTENGERYGIMWYQFNRDNDVTLVPGKKYRVSGTYSKYTSRGSNFTALDNVAVSEAGVAGGHEAQAPANVDAGTRLRGEAVQVKKVFNSSILVSTSQGLEFFIYTKNYGTGTPKYNIPFEEGMTLTVDGTVQVSDNGRPYLNRCKITA